MASTNPVLDPVAIVPSAVPGPAMAIARKTEVPGETRFLIRDIDWGAYRQISEALNDRHYHLSFDGKDLELMTTSLPHDRYGRFVCFMVMVLTDEMNLPRASCGQFTMNREDLEKGIEADETFYIVNEAKMRGKKEVDLTKDPPPDLAVEIDLTTDSRRRLGIYAAIAIPEIWRFDGDSATIYQRLGDGQYAVAASSRYFPFFTAADLSRFLGKCDQTEEGGLLREFRAWVREQVAKK